MFNKEDVVTKSWSEYELIDSGEGRKLERFGEVVTDRPDTQAIWPQANAKRWSEATARFDFVGKDGKWWTKNVPASWLVAFHDARFNLRLTNFKHVGLFPEHAAQWAWIEEQIKALKSKSAEPKVLNLFGYTGAASIVAAQAGAKVTHVDASKQSVNWASDNAESSKLSEGIRWIVDDAAAFVRREVKRGNKYDGVILDPPAFGRGAKGQVWHIEEDLKSLLEDLKEILSDTPGAFVVLSGYAAGYAPEAFAQLVSGIFGAKISGTYGALHIAESTGNRLLPTGIYVRLNK